jgi:sRNA-binding carbon storage regulator CsrA
MLIINQRKGDSIIFTLPNGEEIRIILKKTTQSRNLIAIQAPKEIQIKQEKSLTGPLKVENSLAKS